VVTLAFKTLGCRANQCDTNALVTDLLARGCTLAGDLAPPNLILVNTCAVTGVAERKSRQAIRRARRLFPDAMIAVLGCLPTLDRDAVLSLGADLVFTNAERESAVPSIADALAIQATPPTPASASGFAFHGRTRAFVKIQDGCDHFCSYCIVAHLRGPMRSRPADEVMAQVEGFAAAGHREIVLTGIRTGAYDGGIDLAGLIERIADIPRVLRIRLSSIEPLDVSDRLIECVGAIGKVCPHLHIPLQSGSERVLAGMRRGYGPGEYAALLDRIRAVRPQCAVTTDVLVGYPSEGEDDFAATKNFVAEQGFARLHVFPYSPRPRTAAAEQHRRAHPAAGARAEQMLQVSADLAAAWNRRWLGKTATVLVEEDGGGYTPDYVRVRLEEGSPAAGTLARVRVRGADREGLRGVVEEVEG
jgi:threonylcarbamoyladenosine tRNA methylthiotransferase MtaB